MQDVGSVTVTAETVQVTEDVVAYALDTNADAAQIRIDKAEVFDIGASRCPSVYALTPPQQRALLDWLFHLHDLNQKKQFDVYGVRNFLKAADAEQHLPSVKVVNMLTEKSRFRNIRKNSNFISSYPEQPALKDR